MSILVTTPTGHIGSRIVERLIDEGAAFGVFARKPSALPQRVRDAATVHQGDLEDPESLRRAAEGADVVFFLIPPKWDADDMRAYQRQLAQNAVDALTGAGVDRVVFLSSGGAQRDDLGPISGLGDAETMLEDAFSDVVHLRAGYFMENFFNNLPTIEQEGAIYSALSPETKTFVVATRDIGDVAVRWLLDESWSGHHVAGIHGPEDLSMREAAQIISDGLGRDVNYVQVPAGAVEQAVKQTGASDSVAANYREMVTGLEKHGLDYADEERTDATTTPTTLSTFVETTLRPALESKAHA